MLMLSVMLTFVYENSKSLPKMSWCSTNRFKLSIGLFSRSSYMANRYYRCDVSV